ncbi:MAG: hypothetical protein C4K48_11210 [Candidatus Thorarchaeota archaeon]|nr:MAG: hypothetical protein C4K48_11210 [Candidatus Thorarchaeota archaeon]
MDFSTARNEEADLMRIVAAAQGIEIRAPDDAYFSYFNSPYIGHSLGTAVDIYPRHQEWGGPVPAPVSGRVTRIKKLHMGSIKPFPTDDFDYGIALAPENAESDIVRVMHAEPAVREGSKVDEGDEIGRTIRSRYFNYWTGPHYHVEAMPASNFTRSSKSIPLDVRMEIEPHQIGTAPSNIEMTITEVTDDHAIGYPQEDIHTEIGDLSGLSAQDASGSAMGIIDGGLSHYQHGGVFGRYNTDVGEIVCVANNQVGTAASSRGLVTYFRRGPSIRASIDGIELRGLSCFLYPPQYKKRGMPQLILIPKRYGGFRHLLEDDSSGTLRIEPGRDRIRHEDRHES